MELQETSIMATLTIRNIDAGLEERMRICGARNKPALAPGARHRAKRRGAWLHRVEQFHCTQCQR
jgi:hypothetical protein